MFTKLMAGAVKLGSSVVKVITTPSPALRGLATNSLSIVGGAVSLKFIYDGTIKVASKVIDYIDTVTHPKTVRTSLTKTRKPKVSKKLVKKVVRKVGSGQKKAAIKKATSTRVVKVVKEQ